MVFRAAVHAHSNWSYDGQWTIDQIANALIIRGYNLLLMTEHDLGLTEEKRRAHREACRSASTDQMMIIPGIEYSDPTNTVHILIWGDVPFLGAGKETQRTLKKAVEQGGVCVLAHPSRRCAWQMFRKEWLEHLAAIEIWNRKTDGWSPSVDAKRLILETGASPIVGLDFHNAKQFFPLTVRFEIENKPEEREILDALRIGLFHNEAFGMNVGIFADGFGSRATRLLESGRRFAARSARAWGFNSTGASKPRLPAGGQIEHRTQSESAKP